MSEFWSGIMDPTRYGDRDAMLAEAISEVSRKLAADGKQAGGPLEAWTTAAGDSGLVRVHVGMR